MRANMCMFLCLYRPRQWQLYFTNRNRVCSFSYWSIWTTAS